jgi:hypothetical protein
MRGWDEHARRYPEVPAVSVERLKEVLNVGWSYEMLVAKLLALITQAEGDGQ